jgi:hypothetical protein
LKARPTECITALELIPLFGLLLMLASKALRWRQGLGFGRTIALDEIMRTSSHPGLAGCAN